MRYTLLYICCLAYVHASHDAVHGVLYNCFGKNNNNYCCNVVVLYVRPTSAVSV